MSEENGSAATEPAAEDGVEQTTAYSTPRGSSRRRVRLLVRRVLMTLGPLVVIIGSGYYYIVSSRYVGTENAYVKADKIAVSTNVPGRVIDVRVEENDIVEAGQILLRLDAAPFEISLAKTEAMLGQEHRDIMELKALHQQKKADLMALHEDAAYFKTEHQRQNKLARSGIATRARTDETLRNVNKTRQQIASLRQQMSQVVAQLGGDENLAMAQHPRLKEAIAERDKAALDLEWTVVRAPKRGVVTNITLVPGEYVQAGTPIFSIVATDKIWVAANLKETDLTHVAVDQNATIVVDSYPDMVWKARVSSIGMATGAEFSLLPPQNASGNWVKVVQRVPVLFELLDDPYDPQLRAGMSAFVKIDIEQERDVTVFFKNMFSASAGTEARQ